MRRSIIQYNRYAKPHNLCELRLFIEFQDHSSTILLLRPTIGLESKYTVIIKVQCVAGAVIRAGEAKVKKFMSESI